MSTENTQQPSDPPTSHADCSDVREWVDADAIAVVKDLISECPKEILTMAAALFNLDITTRDHAGDLDADGFVFKAEEARQRANNYRETLDEICRIWGDGSTNEGEPELTELPSHLRDDAKYLTCRACGRKEFCLECDGERCGMLTPDGHQCGGVLQFV